MLEALRQPRTPAPCFRLRGAVTPSSCRPQPSAIRTGPQHSCRRPTTAALAAVELEAASTSAHWSDLRTVARCAVMPMASSSSSIARGLAVRPQLFSENPDKGSGLDELRSAQPYRRPRPWLLGRCRIRGKLMRRCIERSIEARPPATSDATPRCHDTSSARFVGMRRTSDWLCARCGHEREEVLLQLFKQGGSTWGVLPCGCQPRDLGAQI